MTLHPDNDTIVAQATPVGEGAIGILRLSGPECASILKKIFRGKISPEKFESHRFYLGHLIDPFSKDESPLDQVMTVWMKGPHSFTGEDAVEIHAHGGPVVLTWILKAITALGIRLAEPGEFSKRAYLNGKLDLSQAEAIADLISSQNEWAAKNALQQLDGYLSRTVERLRSQIIDLLALVEAGFDFVEEDVQLFDPVTGRTKLLGIQKEIKILLDSFQTGKLYKEGLKIALVGKPNVGKSSLLNALLNEDRAIIHHEPGTTRDVVQGERKIRGLNVTFSDTAGIREAESLVEQEGIRRSEKILEQSDLVCLVLDSSRPLTLEDDRLLELTAQRPSIIIYSKSDLPSHWRPEERLPADRRWISLSATQREGLETLLETIYSTCVHTDLNRDHGYVLNNVRHQASLQKVYEILENLLQSLETNSISEECLAEEFRLINRELGAITGVIGSEVVLDEIFARFCIGK